MDNNSHKYSYKSGVISIVGKTNVGKSTLLNNILDAEYSETNLVPMPGFNSLAEIKYSF